MPSYSDYVPKAQSEKQGLLYTLWGRPTLYYDPECSKPIDEALDVLFDLKDGQYDEFSDLMKTNAYISIGYFAGFAVYMVVNMIAIAGALAVNRAAAATIDAASS
eukprot:CAMPEP_0170463412 /NCGR_PEP_ID=MMETSP0123-20130129/8533_1 /TAXON_ID=182087 /ORGANISM="Favella ehrenbergii, Strain Fehren 1" /LENGTH=104 /DNA_ID=CAMNT_0010728837 /DNA_START=1241 /DNA_END=1556 /DNA_ORIENTATION=+